MKIVVTCLLVFAIAFVGFSATRKTDDRHPILKIVVKADGTVFADGRESTISELTRQLDALKESGGLVWFYHARRGEPDPKAKAVFQLIVNQGLPFGMYEDEAFRRRTSSW